MITDCLKLEQILRNLIDNAVKFTEHGSVTITAHNCEKYRQVKFTVADTGIGIAKANHSVIFEKLYQIESSDNRRYEGIGLGLYIVKKLSDLIGATVEVKSNLGMVATFTVSVPWQ
jgi:signal transduction histidine kinase